MQNAQFRGSFRLGHTSGVPRGKDVDDGPELHGSVPLQTLHTETLNPKFGTLHP